MSISRVPPEKQKKFLHWLYNHNTISSPHYYLAPGIEADDINLLLALTLASTVQQNFVTLV